MKAIAGTILIVASAIFYHARTDLAGRNISYGDAMDLIRTCDTAAKIFGVAGVILTGAGLLPNRHSSENGNARRDSDENH